MPRRLACLFTVLALVAPAVARADVLPPDTSTCEGKKADDACTIDTQNGAAGACVEDTCTRNTYARAADGGITRGSESYSCLRCKTKPGGCGMGVATAEAAPWLLALAVPFALRRRRAKR